MNIAQACSILQLPFCMTSEGLISIYFVHTSKLDYFLSYNVEDVAAAGTGHESSQGQMDFGPGMARAVIVSC